MANNTQDTTLLSALPTQAVSQKAEESGRGPQEVVDSQVRKEGSASPSPPQNADKPSASSNTPPPRPSLVQLGSTSSHSSTTQPKKFSSFNINKKFLEKNSPSSVSSHTASASSTAKSGGPVARSAVPQTTSHSRLVTAKLTTSPANLTTGWSRPPSVAQSPATASGSPSSTPLPGTPPGHTSSAVSSTHKDGTSSKPAWGNLKPASALPTRPDIEPSDFPTAAEVANVASSRKATKPDEPKGAVDSAARQARLEEADTFRGVHLDPNAHHWDEMEEDDDNFLEGVIEFGDGRQYKVEAADSQRIQTPSQDSTQRTEADSSVPVRKEDRFVDDFDRSWPRSRPSPSTAEKPLSAGGQSRSPTASPAISHPTHSPKESSRVLFNERSNRLEPYNQRQTTFAKRSSFQEGTPPLHESRGPPPGSKPDFSASRRRRFSNSSGYGGGGGPGGGPPPPGNHDRPRDRDRDHRDRRDGPSLSPRIQRSEFTPHHGPSFPRHDRQLPPHLSPNAPSIPRRLPSHEARRRPSDASLPPPSAVSATRSPRLTRDALLQSPNGAAPLNIPLNGADLDEARKGVMHTAAERAKQRRLEEEAEREAQKERARRKAAELEEKMKAAEAEKARLKEAEEKAKAVQEKEVLAVIEDAVRSSTDVKIEGTPIQRHRPPSLPAVSRDSEAGISQRPGVIPPLRSATLSTPSPASQSESWRAKAAPLPPAPSRPAEQPSIQQPSSTSGPTLVTSTRSALEQVEMIADDKPDDLEVVDFSDMGKFVGDSVPSSSAPAPESEEVTTGSGISKSRPAASDFFDDAAVPTDKQHDFNVWRRRVSHGDAFTPATQGQKHDVSVPNHRTEDKPDASSVGSTLTSTSTSATGIPKEIVEPRNNGDYITVPPYLSANRSPRSPAFPKEASMSSLNNTISRIKGAMDASKETQEQNADTPRSVRPSYHPSGAPARQSPKDRWVPPALRPRTLDQQYHPTNGDDPREIFLFTMPEPPSSPVLATIPVNLPPTSASRRHVVEHIPKKQFFAFTRPAPSAKMDVLSFEPPVYDMNRRTWSLTDVLFPLRPYKGTIRYRVLLPKTFSGGGPRGPKVHIPSSGGIARASSSGSASAGGVTPGGAFGKPTNADGVLSWRKSTVPTIVEQTSLQQVDTMSRSPPPEYASPQRTIASLSKSSDTSPSKGEGKDGTVKSRSQPKMPIGSSVGFYRDSADAKPTVNFIVGDLDESKSPRVPKEDTREADAEGKMEGDVSEVKPQNVASAVPLRSSESQDSNSSATRSLVTPPDPAWSKPGVNLPTSRAPDPEHLKAVWSQSSTKTGLQPVNSLQGITDDLPNVSYSLQDVKSEGEATPPPTLPAPPSRMSLHDVTKAFQQVPSSSSSSSNSANQSQPQSRTTTVSPPSAPAPARPNYNYAPIPPTSMRPYPYASPMMSHSPAPGMYPHPHPMNGSPVPSRMQPAVPAPMSPMYSQPMWMPMSGPGPQGPNMRPIPIPSPYPGQMVPYPPTPYGQPPHAPLPPPGPHAPPPHPQSAAGAPNMMPGTPQAQNAAAVAAGRGRGMMVSPIMGPAHAHPHPAAGGMYGGSPVMYHPAANHGYMPVGPGRGRGAAHGATANAVSGNGSMAGGSSDGGQQQGGFHQQNNHHPHHPHHPPSFNHAAPSSYVRSGW